MHFYILRKYVFCIFSASVARKELFCGRKADYSLVSLTIGWLTFHAACPGTWRGSPTRGSLRSCSAARSCPAARGPRTWTRDCSSSQRKISWNSEREFCQLGFYWEEVQHAGRDCGSSLSKRRCSSSSWIRFRERTCCSSSQGSSGFGSRSSWTLTSQLSGDFRKMFDIKQKLLFTLASILKSSSMSRVTSTSYSLSLASPTTSITSVLKQISVFACELGFWARQARFGLCSRQGLGIGTALVIYFLARRDSGQGWRVFYNAEQGEKSSVLVSFLTLWPQVFWRFILYMRSFGKIIKFKYRKV